MNLIFANVNSAGNVVYLFIFRTFKLNLGFISYFVVHRILSDAVNTECNRNFQASCVHPALQPQKRDIK